MTATFNDLIASELHLHILGAYTTEDMLALARDCYRQVDWNEEDFMETYNRLCEETIDPVALFEDALSSDTGMERLRRAYVYGNEDGGNFARWEIKNRLFLCVWGHYRKNDREHELLDRLLARDRESPRRYVEYRCGSGMGGFLFWHELCARVLMEASNEQFSARYIVSIPRYAPMEAYDLLQQILDQHPDLVPTIVGVDFASVEEGNPPTDVRPFFERLQQDNNRRPQRALDAVYHVGESYFDKSLESAIRWCHEVAEMGACRIGHAIALGLDPEVAIARQSGAHEVESVRERLDQVRYDLLHAEALAALGVRTDVSELETERRELERLGPEETVRRMYDAGRIAEVRQRQTYVLDCLVRMGTVIESCPTSNLRIGGVPEPQAYPIFRFLETDVDLAICTDDPGGFDVTLEHEVEWVVRHGDWTRERLAERLGDPYRFRLGQRREQT